MKIVSIVGARPEFVQVAVLSHSIRERHAEVLIHTGQHYDERMSDRFFSDLSIPDPDINLGIGSRGASAQTAEMLARLAEVFARESPDLVIVRGDTNSTLAAALAAKQALLPLAHVEGGMRSYDRTMPEELNRVVADHISDVALVTDDAARDRLATEGIVDNVFVCGDVMYDVFLRVRANANGTVPSHLRSYLNAPYDLVTLHRAENTDDASRLAAIVAGFADAPRRVVFPIHPRTRARLSEFGIALPPCVTTIEPLGYPDMVTLECNARTILTDSGGVQREAYFAGVPCTTLRDSTEWTNTVDAGWNRLVGASTALIAAALREDVTPPAERPPLFGDGHAAGKIVAALESPAVAAIVAAARATQAARGHAASASIR